MMKVTKRDTRQDLQITRMNKGFTSPKEFPIKESKGDKNMKYVYIHGFNSGKNSSTGKTFKSFLGDEVVCLEYDSSRKFSVNLSRLKSQLFNVVNDEEFVLIGSSLGGFYVERLGLELKHHYNHIGNVLINPCNNPKEQLRQFLGKTKSWETGKEWEFTEKILNSYDYIDTRSHTINRIVIIGEKDDVIDPLSNYEYWINKAEIYLEKDGRHQIESIYRYIPVIKSLENTF